MKITSKKIDDLSQVLTVFVAADDYSQARKKKLNDLQRRAEIPGFRKGKVPSSLIEKFYGENALSDAVNTLVGQALQDYIKDNNLNVIGEPLPTEDKIDVELIAGNDFTFTFDIAVNPEVSLSLDSSDEVEKFNITVSSAEKKKLVDAYLSQEGNTATEEELEKQVAAQLKSEYAQASVFRLEKDIRDYCVKKAALQLPEKFLRRWLLAANEGKLTPEQIDKDFEGFLADYRWQLVMTYLTKEYDIKIEKNDLHDEAVKFARYQYSMYGIANVPDDALESFVQNMLSDQSNVQSLVENVQASKVIEAVKSRITVKDKRISAEKFREL